MSRIFTVVGSTGEYADRTEWAVASFTRKGRAETWSYRASLWAFGQRVHAENKRGYIPDAARAAAEAEGNPYDPNMQIDYNGVSYRITTTPLDPLLPTAGELRAAKR